MTITVISAALAALAVAFSGWLAYRAQNRGVSVTQESVVLESYDELVAHLRSESLDLRAQVQELRAQVAEAMGREARCEARIREMRDEVAHLTQLVESFTKPPTIGEGA